MSDPEKARRDAVAYQHAMTTDLSPGDYLRFCEAAEKTFQAVRSNLTAAGIHNRRTARKRRRALLTAAMDANGVPKWIRMAWAWRGVVTTVTLGLLGIPAFWSPILQAIFWAVDQYLGTDSDSDDLPPRAQGDWHRPAATMSALPTPPPPPPQEWVYDG